MITYILISIQLAQFAIKVYPAFLTPYFDECISQQLATICYPLQVPTWQAIFYFLSL